MQADLQQFMILKRAVLENEFSKMNAMQREAVFHVNGPLLILAGAGSGKTTVLINRIAYLVDFGNSYFSEEIPFCGLEEANRFLEAYLNGQTEDRDYLRQILADQPPKPWNILAITFTNKAANEIKERLTARLGELGRDVQAGTFHSICVRMLRKDIERLGYKSSFTIYDTSDSERVMKDCLSELNMSEKVYPPKQMLHAISRCKNQLQTPQNRQAAAGNDFRKGEIAKVYARYQAKLKAANAVDFDDIIMLTVTLLEEYPDVLEYYARRWRYIMVDEYQDTNVAQYRLVSLLSGMHRNLCVVGDDDQSIYKFRGATIENILRFEGQFKHAAVVRLEQNYRSTQNILNAANAVISHNTERKGKNLWTENGEGSKVQILRLANETDEAEYIANTIAGHIKEGWRYSDHAILYRMNAQSASIERYFVRMGLPYRIVGGTKFFDRKEIKDITAYMNFINNDADPVRLRRIINEPKRGIGAATLDHVLEIAQAQGISPFAVLQESDTYLALQKKSGALRDFAALIDGLKDTAQTQPLDLFFDELTEKTGYLESLRALGPEGENRIENVHELKSMILKYMEENEEPSLAGFLEEIALYTDLDDLNSNEDNVILMTMHAAKGLEFPCVFLVGMEEGVFPSAQSAFEPGQLEEERRLAYVGITRAKKELNITTAQSRMLYGQTKNNPPSRFIKEIPDAFRTFEDRTVHAYFSQASSAKAAPPISVSNVGTAKKMEQAVIDYTVGDSVLHPTFGVGIVTNMTRMANDVLVEIAFEKAGTKKVMANFAKLKKA
ncbi:MAG TPA: UvrD-helicase domain-containing protein [Firmicutes bacterium]|nr:UvrD-helicase domain-containing protein [Bacillota bacterium]